MSDKMAAVVPRRRRIGRKRHREWDGFEEIRNENFVITHAKCLKCCNLMVRRDEATLKRHKEICQNPPDKSSVNGTLDNSRNNNLFEPYPSPQVAYIANRMNIKQEQDEDVPDQATKRALAILKFYLAFDVDIEKIQLPCLQNLLHAFDETYVIPSAGDFQNLLLETTNSFFTKNTEKQHLSLIILKISEDETTVYCLAVLSNEESEEPTYIDASEFQKDDDSDSIISVISDFCTSSIKKANDYYNVQVKYVLYESPLLLPTETDITLTIEGRSVSYTYSTFLGMNAVIDRLLDVKFLIPVQHAKLLNSYIEALANLKNSLKQHKLSLCHATQSLLLLLDNHTILQDPSYSAKIDSALENYVHGAHLASNYFQPNFRGQAFQESPLLVDKFEAFIRSSAPAEVFDDLAYYKAKSGTFAKLYADGHDADHERFWGRVRSEDRHIGEYAIDLLKLPGDTPEIDAKLVYDKFLRHTNRSYEYRAFLFSLIWQNM